jgi:hypothetical protein
MVEEGGNTSWMESDETLTMAFTVSHIALISGTVNCDDSSLSVGDNTPPDEQILIWSAPAIISLRAVLRHASTMVLAPPRKIC